MDLQYPESYLVNIASDFRGAVQKKTYILSGHVR